MECSECGEIVLEKNMPRHLLNVHGSIVLDEFGANENTMTKQDISHLLNAGARADGEGDEKTPDTDACEDVIEGDESTKVKCPECKAEMLVQNLARHRRKKHAKTYDIAKNVRINVPRIKCKICGKVLALTSMRRHRLIYHADKSNKKRIVKKSKVKEKQKVKSKMLMLTVLVSFRGTCYGRR
jgi:predicted RNA-binding Zn-ribbon protein involved in translation (DUF1610 family)